MRLLLREVEVGARLSELRSRSNGGETWQLP